MVDLGIRRFPEWRTPGVADPRNGGPPEWRAVTALYAGEVELKFELAKSVRLLQHLIYFFTVSAFYTLNYSIQSVCATVQLLSSFSYFA